MKTRSQRVAHVGSLLQVRWGDAEWTAMERGLSEKLARRTRRARTAAIGVATLLAVALSWGAVKARQAASAYALSAHGASVLPNQNLGGAVSLRDGTLVEASINADWRERAPRAPGEVSLTLDRGTLRLTVAPHRPGEFQLHAGDVVVEVIGTVLRVERQGDRVSVSVERGRVKVTRGAEAPTFLGAGEQRTFDSLSSEPVATPGEGGRSGEPSAAPLGPSLRIPANAGANGWQALARDGEYGAAYGKLNLATIADAPGDLLLGADVARLSGHPAQAVGLLRQVAERHAGDPRAPLAAFTLGRVYLEDLGNPREAALAFRQTRTLQPGGPMEEPALAREVEAWARAGESVRARSVAQDYLARFPNGSKRKMVQRHAEAP